MIGRLFAGMFDDAAMFPPAKIAPPQAVREHLRHRLRWYEELLGPLVCTAARLPVVEECAATLGVTPDGPLDVAVVVPEGIDAVPSALQTARQCTHVRVRAVEAPLAGASISTVSETAERLAAAHVSMYVEIPVSQVSERQVHELRDSNARLKLRTGGTTIDAFSTEEELAAPIVTCAAELLPFKCTAGLHHAVRHRDRSTGFEHHGFLNIALAARVAAGTGSVRATATMLAERDGQTLATEAARLRSSDVDGVRALFASIGTCSIDEPVHDLLELGLVSTT